MLRDENGWKDWKISAEAYEWAELEQLRLQESSGRALTQAELFDRLRSAYQALIWPRETAVAEMPSRYQTLVEEFVRLLEDDSSRFRAFRDTVLAVLSDRLENGREARTAGRE